MARRSVPSAALIWKTSFQSPSLETASTMGKDLSRVRRRSVLLIATIAGVPELGDEAGDVAVAAPESLRGLLCVEEQEDRHPTPRGCPGPAPASWLAGCRGASGSLGYPRRSPGIQGRCGRPGSGYASSGAGMR